MKKERCHAFTLIEVIIGLAVAAVLLSALVVSFIKRLDRIASDAEVTALKSMGAAFKESIRRTGSVPDETGWASAVAGQLGWQLNDATANDRTSARIFLIDPTMQMGTNGSTIRPQDPRFMIISSVGRPLPSTLVSGVGDTNGANAFANIWSTPEGAVPAGWSGISGADLKIQRIDLSDLFVQIFLANADTVQPSYGIDELPLINVPAAPSSTTPTNLPTMYFIRDTELKLHNVGGALEYSEILYTSHEFTFELGTWQGKPFLGRGVGEPNGRDLQRAMDLFLRAPLNPNAQSGATQLGVRAAMIAYMQAFIAWRDAGYPGQACPGSVGNNAFSSAVSAAQGPFSGSGANAVTANLINRN